jgi:DNA uptake protein ComE-like DNA-binding protein
MKNQLRVWLRTYFSFNKKERNGIVLLSLILLTTIVVRLILEMRQSTPLVLDEQAMQAWQQLIKESESQTQDKEDYQRTTFFEKEATPVFFDPNTATYDELIAAGFYPKLAQALLNYRSKGATFKKPEDLKKLYTMSDKFYRRIQAYVVIAEKPKGQSLPNQRRKSEIKSETETKPKRQKSYNQVMINTADSAEFRSLPGIGSYFASKIVSYRQRLGGYVSKNQLLEIKFMRQGLLDSLDVYLLLDIENVTKIKVNQASENELFKHPYIRGKAKALFNYIKMHGALRNKSDLEKVIVFDKEEIDRLDLYFDYAP